MHNQENNIENKKIEMTASEILTKVILDDDEDLKNKAIKAGMDFEKIDEWRARNPELSVGQILQHANIKPEEKFDILG